MVWRYKRYYTDKTLKLRKKIYEHASELRKFSDFYILKLLFPSIFCWYFRYFVSETFSLYHFIMVWCYNYYKRQYTDKALTLRRCIYVHTQNINDIINKEKSMNMRARGASELRKCSHFHILKLLFPSIFCWYFRYFVSETYLFSGVK